MIWIIIALLLAAIVLIVAVRTYKFRPPAMEFGGNYEESGDLKGSLKLAEAIRIRTVSELGRPTDAEAFLRFHEFLEKSFPFVHKYCEKTIVNNFSLVYRLKSDNPEPKRKPILITAHMDVVPVEKGTEGDWDEPPFSGNIEDGVVWGRGALDIKSHLIAAMEAMERLLENGFSPSRDIYLAFGHDEELNGIEGASKIAEHFINSGLEFDFLLDEGGCAVKNAIEGVEKPLALIGVGEKGFANIRLSVTCEGGHASMPAKHTSLGILSQALCRLENHPFKPHLISATEDFLMRVGLYMKGINRVILANLWLFSPLFLSVFSKTNVGGALLRTTVAVTMAEGSNAPNVIPQKSSAVVNCRILPGEDGKMLLAHFNEVLSGLPVEVTPINLEDPASLSPSDCDAYRFIEGLTKEFCGDVIAAPYLVMASTDASKYEPVCGNIYRFTPYVIDNADVGTMHGMNEKISVSNMNRCIDFFKALMERA